MKEFTIEDFTINSDNSVEVDFYFFRKERHLTFNEDQIKEVLKFENSIQLEEYLREEFNSDDCEKILKYYIREYAKDFKD